MVQEMQPLNIPQEERFMVILINGDEELSHSAQAPESWAIRYATTMTQRYDHVLLFDEETYYQIWGNKGLCKGKEVLDRIALYE